MIISAGIPSVPVKKQEQRFRTPLLLSFISLYYAGSFPDSPMLMSLVPAPCLHPQINSSGFFFILALMVLFFCIDIPYIFL